MTTVFSQKGHDDELDDEHGDTLSRDQAKIRAVNRRRLARERKEKIAEEKRLDRYFHNQALWNLLAKGEIAFNGEGFYLVNNRLLLIPGGKK